MAISRLRMEAMKERKKKQEQQRIGSTVPTSQGNTASQGRVETPAPVQPVSRLSMEASKERERKAQRQTAPTISTASRNNTPVTNTTTRRSREEIEAELDVARKTHEKAATEYVRNVNNLLRKDSRDQIDELMKAMDEARNAVELLEKELKYTTNTYDDDFFGQFGANYDAGRLTQDTNAAYNAYLTNPTEESKARADALAMLEQQFQTNNQAALDDEGAKATWITKTAAGYLPQFFDQTAATVGGGAAGGLAGAGAGSVIPVIGTGTGAVWGARAGAVAASGAYSYGQMRGAAYRELLNAGVDEETARAAANDEAVISALIEMGDTAWTVMSLGTGKLLETLGKGGIKAVAGEGAEIGGKKLLKELAKFGIKDVGQEWAEEGLQQGVSIANQNRDNTGMLNLAGETVGTLWDAATGKNMEARDEILDAANEGAKIAFMFGGTGRAIDIAGSNLARAKIGKSMQAMGGDETVQAMIETGLESDKNTESYQLAAQMQQKLNSGKALTNVEIGRLQQANVKAIEAEASQSASDPLMELAKETVAEQNASQQTQADAAVATNSRSNVPYNVMSMENPARKARDNAIKNTGYGENGIKAFTEALDASGESVDQMRAKFQNAYELGRFDTPREKVNLVTDLQKIAYNAGRMDYIADMGKEVNTTTAGAKSGFDSTGAPSFVTSTQTRIVDDLAKALGSQVVIGKSRGNAHISGSGAVVIADDFQTKVGDSDVSIVYHAAHEIGMHRLMQLAPTEGRAFLNAMYNYMSEGRPQTATTLVEDKQSAYAEQRVSLTTEKAAEEVVANNILSLYENEEAFGEAVRRIANGNDQQAKRGLQKFREILDDVVKKLRGIIAKLTGKDKIEAQQALGEVEHLREMYESALAAAVKKNKELEATKNAAQTSDVEYQTTADGLKYSLKMSFAEQVEAALNRELDRNTAVYVMNTPEMLQALGMKEYPMLITQRHIRDINHEKSPKNTHWHGLSEDIIKKMPDMIANPVMLLESATAGDVVVVSSVLDSDNFPVIISIHPDGNGHYNRAEIASNFVTSMYGRRGFGAFMETAIEKDRVLYVNKKRTRSLYSRVRLQLPKSLDRDGFIKDSIAPQEDVVNGETQYSLVTDKKTLDFLDNQKLVKVYRAMQEIDGKLYPPMAAITKGQDGKSQLVSSTKKGAWYQSDERPDLIKLDKKGKPYFELKKGNGKMVPAAYNPYFHTSVTPLNDQFSSAFDRPNLVVVEGYIPESELTSGYKAQYAKDSVGETTWHAGPVASKLKGDKARRVFLSRWFKAERVVPVEEVARTVAKTLDGEGVSVPWNVVTPSLREALENEGVEIDYKDIKMGSKVVSFESTQEDVQHSLKDSTGRTLSPGQQEYFKDSKVRDEDGNLLVMYHGTPNGDFTVFKDGSYFTASKEYADRYQSPSASSISTGKEATAPKTFAVYLDIKKPFDITDPAARDIYINEYIKGGNAMGINPYLSDAEYRKIKTVDWTEGEDLRDFLIENEYDYDGLVLDEGADGGYGDEVAYRGQSYVVFSPEQVKDIDNLNPTDDPDIRYSLKDGASVEELRARLEGIELKLDNMRKVKRKNFPSAEYERMFDEQRAEYKEEARKLREEIKALSYPQVESADPVDSKSFAAWFGDWKSGEGSKVVDANGKPLVVYHGTGTTIEEFLPEFTGQGNDQYGSGFYFTTEKATAERYSGATLNGAEKPGGMDNPNVIPVYLNIRNPIVVNASETPNLYDIDVSATMAARIIAKAPNIMDPEESILGDFIDEYWEQGPQKYMIKRLAQEYDWTLGSLETDVFRDHPTEFRQAVKSVLGYDGVQVNFDSGEKHFVAWFPNQIKHATQNNGAFSKKDNRIMFSLKEQNDLLKENAKLKEVNEGLREQFKTTTFAKVDKKSLDKFTKAILKDYQSGADINEIRDALNDVYTYMANGEDGHGPAWNDLQERAYNVAVSILENASTVNDEMYQAYKSLRDRLRSYPISISSEYNNSIMGYESLNDFRKANFGRIKISNDGTPVDIVYADLANTYPEFFDESEYVTQADQIAHIADVLDSLQPYEVNPYSGDMRRAATWLASDILERFYELPQAKPTFADKQAAKLTKQVIKDNKKLENLREKKNERIRDLIQKNREKVKATTQKEREKRVEAVKEIKDHYKAKEKKASESRKARELRAKIMRHAQEMSKKLLRPTDKQHIPQNLQGAVAKLLEAINLESNYTYDPNSKSYKRNDEGLPSNRTKAFAELRKLYAEMASELVIDPDLLGEDGLLSEVAGLADKRIADMTSEELETVYRTLRAVEASVSSANKAFAESRWASIEEAAESIRADNKNKGQMTEYAGLVGWGQKLTGLDMMTPEAFFHRLGESGDGLFRMLRNAQDKHIQLMKSVEDFTHKELENVPVKKWEKELKTVKLGGENVQLTTAQIMELYVLTKRKQAIDHIFKGGILPESVAKKGIKKITRAEPVRGIDIGEVSKAISLLTAEQKAVADKLQKFASTELSKWGNEAAMQVYNYEKFNEDVYWPIRSNRQEISSTVEKDTQVTSVAGRGFSKNTKPNANTSVKVGSIFDTFATHSSEMATYAAWLAPAEDLNRIRNYTFLNEEGGRAGTVKGIIERVHGSRGTQYLQKLLSDIANGVGAGRGNETRMDQIVGNYKASAIGANLRVIIQQPTAVLRALDMIDPKYLASTKNPLSGWKKAKKYAPIAQWKDWGYFDINTGRQMKDVLFDTDDALEKVKQFTMAGAGWADSFTWGALWNAVENETRATRDNLKPGSEEFYKAVAARFTEIVDRTQVVDGILQRSQIMRSADGLTKMATSFMGEPTKQYNMFMSALYDIRNKEGRERSMARKRMARTLAALITSGVVNAAAQSIIDAVRDDDEEKDYWEKWLTQFFGLEGDEETTGDKIKAVAFSSNVMNIFNPAGYIPYAKDVVSIFQGYDVSRMDMESIEKTISAWNNLWKAANGEGNYTVHGAAINLLGEAARLFGVPVANLKREITTFATHAAQSSDNFIMQYHIEKVFTNVENSSSGVLNILYQSYKTDKEQFNILYKRMLRDDELKKDDTTTADVIAGKLLGKVVDDLYALYKTDAKAYEEMYNDLIRRDFLKTGVQTGDPETDTFKSTADHIATAMETRMKKEQGVDKVSELEKRYFGPEQQREYDRKLKEIQSSSVWKSANEDQRDKLEDNLRGIVNETDSKMLETIAEGAEYGLDDTEYLLYKLALETVDQPNENGKYGSYSNAEKAAAITSAGLGDSEIAYLWDTDQALEAFGYGIDMDKYITFKSEISNIKADKDSNGKTISGSRKDKVIAYLNSLGLSYKEYLYLLGTEYDLSKDGDYKSYFGE